MINPTGKKLEKIVNKLFDEAIEGVDRYNNNGSLWLIFTDEMRWVVEYTKGQTLWYNYNFFRNEMELVGLDCIENKDLIQKWFESRFLNTNEVKVIDDYTRDLEVLVEDTIQNGVKRTAANTLTPKVAVEDTIQNGVKRTGGQLGSQSILVEDIIQNGVKGTKIQELDTWDIQKCRVKEVEDIIQNVVKDTKNLQWMKTTLIEDTVQNGVKL
jgi:hypothetical protein